MRFVVFVSAFMGCLSPAWGCAWDSNTLADELALENGIERFDLITGQFPHHGQAFYEAQLARSRTQLKADPSDWTARNDAAVALMKLERYDASLAELEVLFAQDPERYETLSNLGVLHKKRGDFGKAASFIERALAIKPEGHMGLGDFYLRMLRFLEKPGVNADGEPLNFLGLSYGADARDYLYVSHFEHLGFTEESSFVDLVLATIRNDRSFADAYVVLGDMLMWQQPSLALWAYVRARDLGHPRPELVDESIGAALNTLRGHAENDNTAGLHYVADRDTAVSGIRDELVKAEAWLSAYQALESKRVAEGEPADFGSVLAALEEQGVSRMRSSGHAVRRGIPGIWANTTRLGLLGFLALLVGLYAGVRRVVVGKFVQAAA